ncbi:hypothetical protein M5K25_018864 [Dendrobium thyrsiflorum]|uniref:RNase H type-1 domain-containing protein n=1 Tax=Dendrobium thyrsiflorum TaxID=117978 RepID=A0ABD0UDP3_DENTH
MVLATNAFCMAVASFNCNLSLENWDANQLQLSNVSWCPPPPRWIKANVDATVSINNRAGIGVVFRDCKGRFLFAFGRSLLHWDIAQVEVLSILAVGDTIKDWMIQADGIIIESDNSNIIRFFIDIINNNLDKEASMNRNVLCCVVKLSSGITLKSSQENSYFSYNKPLGVPLDVSVSCPDAPWVFWLAAFEGGGLGFCAAFWGPIFWALRFSFSLLEPCPLSLFSGCCAVVVWCLLGC